MQRKRNSQQRTPRKDRGREKMQGILLLVLGLVILFVALFALTRLAPHDAPIRKLPPRNESFSDGKYLNREWGIDFTYPKEWGTLDLDEYEGSTAPYDLTRETVHFRSTNPEIVQVALHVPSGTIVFLKKGDASEESIFTIEPPRGRELYRLLPDGSTENVYTIPESYIQFGSLGAFSYVRFSPSGRYIYVPVITSIETSVEKAFDLQTKADLFGGKCYEVATQKVIACPERVYPHASPGAGQYTLEELIEGSTFNWSEDENVLAVTSFGDYAGFSVGIDGLFVSDYGDPGQINVAFTRDNVSPPLLNDPDQCGLCPLTIDDIAIDNEGIVTFGTAIADGFEGSGDAVNILDKRSFQYDAKTKELQQVAYENYL